MRPVPPRLGGRRSGRPVPFSDDQIATSVEGIETSLLDLKLKARGSEFDGGRCRRQRIDDPNHQVRTRTVGERRNVAGSARVRRTCTTW
jgi:hypothetical protein